MIVRTARGADYEARDMFANASNVPPPGSRYGAATGRWVDDDAAGAVPAASAAVRLLAETGGLLPMRVREGMRGDPAAAVRADVPEASVLAQPNYLQSAFDVWSYAIASMQRGGALFLKSKDRAGRVAELFVLDPRRWTPKVEKDGRLVFKVREGTKTKTLDQSSVIYVPGFLSSSPVVGCSVVANHANSMGVALALEEFEARFFQNDATPGGVLTVPGNPKKPQRDELRESWESRHAGVGNAHRVGIVWGGASYESIGISLQDAQFIEAQGFSIAQVARIYRVPVKMLTGEADENDPEVENHRFLTYSLSPWLTRLEQGLSLDRDLFPAGANRFAEFDTRPLTRTNFTARAKGYREARQGGWMSANEIRRQEGLGDHPDGNGLQQTPVGGAPNPGAAAS